MDNLMAFSIVCVNVFVSLITLAYNLSTVHVKEDI